MKRNIILTVLLVVLTFCSFGISACDSGSSSGKRGGLDAPNVMAFGDYISWEEIKDAEKYEIYCDEVLIDTTDKTTYTFGEIDEDISVYIRAINGKKKSKDSNTVVLCKTKKFLESEIIDMSELTEYSAIIQSNIRKIIIGNEMQSEFILNCEIADRIADLTFELHNVDIVGGLITQSKTYLRSDNNYNVIFNINGECSFTGLDGENGFDYSGSSYKNQEINAKKGEDGKSALTLPSIIVTGTDNFTIKGGNGGKGGRGSSSADWADALPGKGANGGDGAGAVKTSYLLVKLSPEKRVVIIEGTGGEKGLPGINGSVLTGPWVSMAWGNYDIGKQGKVGESIITTKKLISGNLKTAE